MRLANDRKAETMQCYMAQWAERVQMHVKTLSSGFREASFWTKNGLRSNVIASKFQKCQKADSSDSGGFSKLLHKLL